MILRTIILSVVFTASAGAIVIGYNGPDSGLFGDPNSPTYLVGYNTIAGGMNLNGVVEVGSGVGTCSGALLSDGQSILTAAHCLLPDYGNGQLPSQVQVFFNYPGCGDYPYCNGTYTVTNASSLFIDPTWVSSGEQAGQGNDLAVIRLDSPAPSFATGYSLFTGNSIDLSTPLEVVGAGASGQGENQGGAYPAGNQMRQGESQYIGTCTSGPIFVGGCDSSYNLLAQFSANSPLSNQVEIAGGDSGGPTFYNGQLIGVHEFTACTDGITCAITNDYSLWGDTYAGGANAQWIESVEVNIPEPAPAILLAVGLGAMLRAWRRQRRLSR